MSFVRCGLLFGVCLSLASGALAEPARGPIEAKLVTFPIPLFVEDRDNGRFVLLAKEIAKRSHQKISIQLMPVGKALVEFSSGKFHGFFPAHGFSLPKNALRSETFYNKKDYIFYRQGVDFSSIKSIEGKKVGLTFRYIYTPALIENKKIRFEYAQDDFANMKKLGDGRIDAFVVEEISGLKALQESGFTNIVYNKEKPISEQLVFFGFQSDETGRVLNAVFSETLLKMKKEGSLEKILEGKTP